MSLHLNTYIFFRNLYLHIEPFSIGLLCTNSLISNCYVQNIYLALDTNLKRNDKVISQLYKILEYTI